MIWTLFKINISLVFMKSYNPCSFESGAPVWVHYCLACAGKFPEAMAFCWYSASKCGLWELAWRPFCFLTIEENSKIFPFRPLTTRLSLIKCIAASLSQSLTPFLLFPWSWPLFYRLSSIIKANLFRHTNERRSQEYIYVVEALRHFQIKWIFALV